MIQKFPVFKPNDYFWKHHWEPNKDKETRADTYTRVIREIMINGSHLKDANHIGQKEKKELFQELEALEKLK